MCPLLDESGLKQQFLASRCTLERLQAVRQVLQQLGNIQQSQGCSIM